LAAADCETFDILGRWEIDRGPQNLHYDFWWNLPRDYMVTSEWGLPPSSVDVGKYRRTALMLLVSRAQSADMVTGPPMESQWAYA
jgi:hypothetical protein